MKVDNNFESIIEALKYDKVVILYKLNFVFLPRRQTC